jgi:hypothetical protein
MEGWTRCLLLLTANMAREVHHRVKKIADSDHHDWECMLGELRIS